MVDRKKKLQKFHNEDVKAKKDLGTKGSRSYRKKLKALRKLETKAYQEDRVVRSGRSSEVKVIKMEEEK